MSIPAKVSLRQLRAFLAVGRTASFTLAAESLHITQSALSGLVKNSSLAAGASPPQVRGAFGSKL